MSIKNVSLLKTSVSIAAISGLLILGGCKGGDKAGSSLSAQELSVLSLDKNNGKVFGSYFETGACTSNEQEALGALAGLGLGEDGDQGISFSKREANGATISYSDLKMDPGGSEVVSAKSAVFHCAGMTDENPSFKRVDLKDLKISEDGTNINIGTLVVADATGSMSAAVFDEILGGSTIDLADGFQFPAITASDIDMDLEDMDFSAKSFAFGHKTTEEENNFGDIMIEDVSFKMLEPDTSEEITIDFEGLNFRNLNLDSSIDGFLAGVSGSSDFNVFDSFTFGKKPYDEFSVGKFNLNSSFVTVDSKGMEGKATEKGGIITIKQNMDPVTINILDATADVPDFAAVYQQLKSLGFESMTFLASSESKIDSNKDSFTVSDGRFIMQDAFTLNLDYHASGLAAMEENLKAMTEDELLANPLGIYNGLKINNFKMTLEDQSIIERSIKLAADMTGQSEDQLKSMVALGAAGAGLAATNELEAKLYVDTATAFAEFINKGGNLTIEMNPQTPLDIGSLMDGGDLDPETLRFSASQSN